MQPIFSILQQVDSTNNYAMAAIRNGTAIDGSCWFAKHQTNGKGQRGKQWENDADKNIAMSVVIKPKDSFAHNLFILNAFVANTIRSFCEKSTSQKGFAIKWPNDIYFGDKKAAGILIENIVADQGIRFSVIGIGINVNQEGFTKDLPNATSLKIISGKDYQPIALAEQLHQEIISSAEHMYEEEIMNTYNSHLYKSQEQVRLKQQNASFTTTIKSVNNFGQLITNDVIERSFNFGEVVWEIGILNK